jgi:RNA 3'-terminal phosphate cyclase (ATP)
MADSLTIDGSHGEGGGQILRSALALSVITGREIALLNIRAGRPKPGLYPQHLASVHAAASLCDAAVSGAHLGSVELRFSPRRSAGSGDYAFDVASHSASGSAGSALLVLHTVLYPLALAAGRSAVVIHGGTHVPWSPTTDHAWDALLPALAAMGIRATLTEQRTGWYPAGGGAVAATIEGRGGRFFDPFNRVSRGALVRVSGRALAANLPSHIAQRMADRARSLLAGAGIPSAIAVRRVSAACAGAGLFLCAEYACGARAGFSSLGERGKPSERVAEEAVDAILEHHRSGATVDRHLADQLVLPCALATGPSSFIAATASRHLSTNLWVASQFGLATGEIGPCDGGALRVTITPSSL